MTLCWVVPEFHVHVTVPPVCTAVSRGVKRKLLTETPTAVPGADAFAVNWVVGSRSGICRRSFLPRISVGREAIVC